MSNNKNKSHSDTVQATSQKDHLPIVGTDENNENVRPVNFHHAHGENPIWHRAVQVETARAGDEFLVCRRHDGRWELPGSGHVDFLVDEGCPEDYRSAAVREIREELAIDVPDTLQEIQSHLSLISRIKNVSQAGKNLEHLEVYRLDFRPRWGEPALNPESKEGQSDLQWMSVDKIRSLAQTEKVNSSIQLFLKRHQPQGLVKDSKNSIEHPILLGCDVDGTLSEESVVLLANLLDAGVHLAIITGNTADKLYQAFLGEFVRHVAEKDVRLLSRVYIFFQMGGILARFDEFDFTTLDGKDCNQIRDYLLPAMGGERCVLSSLFDNKYIHLCDIQLDCHQAVLEKIWSDLKPVYQRMLKKERSRYQLPEEQDWDNPQLDPRWIVLNTGMKCSVQYAIRGIPSEKLAKNALPPGESIRDKMTEMLNEALQKERIPLVATVGGKSSIDIILTDQSKSKALRYVMGILHIDARSVLYCADELYPGGNDFAVASELEITSFHCGTRDVYHPRIFATEQPGPRGISIVLHDLAAHVVRANKASISLVESFVAKFVLNRIRTKFASQESSQLSAAALQDLLAITTIAFRDAGRRSMSKQLTMLAQLLSLQQRDQPPMGAGRFSRDDN